MCAVEEAQPARGAGPVTTEVTVRRGRVVPPPMAVLATLGLALAAAWVLLTYLTGDLQVSRDGVAFVFAVACGLLGMLVARH